MTRKRATRQPDTKAQDGKDAVTLTHTHSDKTYALSAVSMAFDAPDPYAWDDNKEGTSDWVRLCDRLFGQM